MAPPAGAASIIRGRAQRGSAQPAEALAMSHRPRIFAAAALAALAPLAPAQGPDVYVSGLWETRNFGSYGAITALSLGTTACNQGAAPVDWYPDSNHHPVITQNLYRLAGGRFEQIGQSWAKHGFGSGNGSFCGVCIQPPGGFYQLGINCSDAYDAGTNGMQIMVGPRSQVNPTTGVFPYPFTAPPYHTVIDRSEER